MLTTKKNEIKQTLKAYQNEGDILTLLQDVNITTKKHSPSGAASFCTATAMQGTTAWVDNNNQTFRKVFPKEKQHGYSKDKEYDTYSCREIQVES